MSVWKTTIERPALWLRMWGEGRIALMPKCPLVIVLSVGTFFSEISPDKMLLLADLFLICVRYHRGTYSICCYPYQHKPHIYKTQIKLCKRYASHLLWQCRELKPSHPCRYTWRRGFEWRSGANKTYIQDRYSRFSYFTQPHHWGKKGKEDLNCDNKCMGNWTPMFNVWISCYTRSG